MNLSLYQSRGTDFPLWQALSSRSAELGILADTRVGRVDHLPFIVLIPCCVNPATMSSSRAAGFSPRLR